MDKNIIRPLKLGHYPTPIQYLERLSGQVGKAIFLKRDDFSGIELSGNKTRKLEYGLSEAVAKGCTVVITAGAVQSNHCRATAAACKKLGLGVHLGLFGKAPTDEETRGARYSGNFYLDQLLGATITYIDPSEYVRYMEILEEIQSQYAREGVKAYIVPIGASNGIGNFGYVSCFDELLGAEASVLAETLGCEEGAFDTVVCTVGSGGTYAGLWLGNYLMGANRRVIGVSISADVAYFKKRILEILEESGAYVDMLRQYKPDFDLEAMLKAAAATLEIMGGYQGEGYAIPYGESLDRIAAIADLEGVILDPVYTGKAIHGLLSELEGGGLQGSRNILFVHTGGIFGSFAFSGSSL